MPTSSTPLPRCYVQRLGGLNVYVRNERVRERERVTKAIRARFDGCNAWELACKFGLRVANTTLIRRCFALSYSCTACGFAPRLKRKPSAYWVVLAALSVRQVQWVQHDGSCIKSGVRFG